MVFKEDTKHLRNETWLCESYMLERLCMFLFLEHSPWISTLYHVNKASFEAPVTINYLYIAVMGQLCLSENMSQNKHLFF